MTRMNFPLQRNTLPAVVLCKAGYTVCQHHAPFSPQWFREDVLCLFLLLLSLAFVPLVIPQAIHAETIVSGEVSGVWNVEGSPYLVTDTLIVPEGETLLIEPGVEVIFQDQTDSTRTPVYVFGTLEAAGEEGDSVYFHTAGAAFRGFVSPFEYEDSRIAFNYCVMDSVLNGIESDRGENVIRQSRIRALNAVIFSSFGVQMDTVEYNIFQHAPLIPGQLLYLHLYNGVLRYNDGPDVWVRLCPNTGQNLASIENNSFFSLYVDLARYGGEAVEIRYNHLARADLSAGEMYWHHNESGCFAVSGWADILIENSTFLYLDMWMATGTIRNNQVIETGAIGQNRVGIEISQCGPVDVIDNLIINFQTGIVVHTSPVSRIEGNTVYFRDTGLELRNLSDNEGEIVENILLGDDVNCTGIVFISNPVPLEISYNCIYAVSEVADGLDLDDTNLLTNPIFAGGEPFDYTLQANSPCIDAGDPDSPDDHDGTPADIGCFYYDQTIDNPPVQTIPEEVFAQTGQLLRIRITATDDNGPFSFTFPDLPEWLTEEDELDWVGDTTAVSGTVPEEAEDFSFTVIVEDGEGQTDTSVVIVDVDQRTLLRGEISGVLHVEDSPFYVVEDIVVSEGDSLVIEPGCELQFRYVQDEEQRLSLLCQGTLIAEGTEEDSIKFTMSTEESVLRGWNRIRIDGVDAYASFRFILVHNASLGLQVTNESTANIMHYYSSTSRISIAGALALIDSCYLTSYDNYGYTMIEITNNSNASVTNCLLEDFSIPPVSKAFAIGTGNIYVEKNTITGTSGATVEWNASPVFAQNIFYECGLYRTFVIANYARMNVFNNLFIGTYIDSTIAIQTASITDTISNNIFSNFQLCIYLRNWEDDDETSPVIRNNVFMNSHTGIHSDLSQDRTYHTEYNAFWNVDTPVIDCPLDQTNLIVDPLFADSAYHLYDNSPLIDAGYPGIDWFDTDSTRSDIGLWGGPYGESYTYPLWVLEQPSELPEAFKIFSPYPNPFNSVQHIHLALPVRADVSIRLYNIIGQEAFSQRYPVLSAGYHQLSYDACNLASGMYFLEVHAGKEIKHTRVVLVK